jgi:hypothetical protein
MRTSPSDETTFSVMGLHRSADKGAVRWPALLLVLAAVLAGCEGAASDPKEASPPPRDRVQPLGGNLLNAASLEPIGDRGASVPAGASKELSLAFGSVEAGSVILITNRPENLKAAIGGVPLRKGDLFGVPASFLTLANPGTVTLTLTNEGSKPAAARIQLFGASDRKIELDVEPGVVQPGEPVSFTAKVTEATPEDVVHVRILRDREIVAELEAERVAEDTWRTTYAVEQGGFYAVTARVDGGPPREISGIRGFEVAHRGTRITGFDERTRDTDRDGLIDWLLIRLHVTVTEPGVYTAIAVLGDTDGEPLGAGGGGGPYAKLRPGKHVMTLRWHGSSIVAAGADGPYRIMHVQLTRVKPAFRNETDIRDLGGTKPYRLSDFESLGPHG